MTTLGWQMPSDRIVEDFAGGEHRLVAREHELTDIEPGGERGRSVRAFSLYPSEADPRTAAPVAMLIDPGGQGVWRLLVADSGGGRGRGPGTA